MDDTFSPAETLTQPNAVKWFKVYCGVVCFFYLCFVPVAWIFFLAPPEDMSSADADFFGLVMLIAGLLSVAVFVVPLCVAPRPWVWIYGLVLICFGLTSACCLPACIPLLIHWLKPEVKTYYGSR